MSQKKILTAGPSITEKEVEYVLDAVKNGWNENWDGYLRRFEQAFAQYNGARFAMSTSSCTGALFLSLLSLGVKPGDEVIVPEISWIATASAVRYCDATPVFVDVDPETWCMDPESARRAITPRTRVIVPVHLYGHPTDMEAIMRVAREKNLKVLEDAAPALGAEVNGQKVGSFGDAATFSFQGAKIMTTGEGGMLVTNDEAVHDRARTLNDHGRDKNRAFQINEIGYKFKLSNLQAALGLAQIERIEDLVAKKRLIFSWYKERLGGDARVRLNAERPWARSIFWMSSVVLQGRHAAHRDAVMAGLKERGIDTRPFFPPMSSFSMFERRGEQNPVAYRVAPAGINLPSGHNLTEQDIDRVSRALVEVLDGVGRGS